jgi:Tol biopolymer transport system component
MKRNELKIIIICLCCILFLLPLLVLSLPAPALAEKIYIDITAPGLKRLPIAVQTFKGDKEISDIVKDDLTFTGLFNCLDDSVQIERPDQPFNTASWMGLGVALVVKGRVSFFAASKFSVSVSAYDVSDGREVLKKEYATVTDMARYLCCLCP